MERNFAITHNGKTYYVSYLNSDGQLLGLMNRDNWEVCDEEGEELDIYAFKDTKKEEIKQIEKNARLYNKLISFCIGHFNDYKPKLE